MTLRNRIERAGKALKSFVSPELNETLLRQVGEIPTPAPQVEAGERYPVEFTAITRTYLKFA